jgi:hypothetical protein
LEGVDLGNAGEGNLAFMRADNIGVVTRWDWPTSESFVEDVTKVQLQGVKNQLTLGQHRKDPRSKDWAGYVVGEVLEGGEAARRQVMDTWIECGDLREYKVRDEYRKLKQCIGVPQAPRGSLRQFNWRKTVADLPQRRAAVVTIYYCRAAAPLKNECRKNGAPHVLIVFHT